MTLNKYLLPRLLLAIGLSLFFVNLLNNNRAFAKRANTISGEATNLIPNLSTNGDSLYLVVARPGSNGMDAPRSVVYAYRPINDKTNDGTSTDYADITIQNGCNTFTLDRFNSSTDNKTLFYISSVWSVQPREGGILIKETATGSGIFEVSCDTAVDIKIRIFPSYQEVKDFNPTAPSRPNTDKLTIDQSEFYKISIEARVFNQASPLIYENRYRVIMESAQASEPKGVIGYAAATGTANSDYTGIAWKYVVDPSWGWSTRIGFAPPCGTPTQTRSINFYDTDHTNITGMPSSPFWQSLGNDYSMKWKIFEYNRKTGTAINIVGGVEQPSSSGILTGGNNVIDSIPNITFRSDRVYVVELSNINRANTLQIQLPYDQIYSNEDCNNRPELTINASCTNNTVALTFVYNDIDTDSAYSVSLTAPTGHVPPWPSSTVQYNYTTPQRIQETRGTTRTPPFAPWTFDPTRLEYDKDYTIIGSVYDGFEYGSARATYKCTGPNITCQIISPTASTYENGESINPTIRIIRTIDALAPEIVTAQLSAGGTTLAESPPNTNRPTISQNGSAEVTYNSYTFNSNSSTGNIEFIGTITYGNTWLVPRTRTCSVNPLATSKPYFIVTNGDSVIGGVYPSGTPASCSNTTNPSDANAVSWATVNSATDRKGANVEHVAKVLGTAVDFYSAGGVSTSNKKWLTIANVSGDWGGNAGLATCMTDYHDTTKKVGISAINTDVTKSVQDLKTQAGTNEQIEINGNLTLSSTSEISGKLAVYVTGNVYINSNITQKASYSSRSDIPFFALIVKGNIYIGPTVDQLDGMYIAQPNGGSGGTIFTCGTSSFSRVEQGNVYSQCNNSLTFNGIVQAKDIKLHRTRGTLKNGPEAEKFNNLPELYMANTPFRSDSSSSSSYDSAVSLPPLL